jgi:putative transposase
MVINAFLMAVWQRQSMHKALVDSDLGCQYASSDYLTFMKEFHLIPSMIRRGNCHDHAVAESLFATFKKQVTKADIFNFIEMFYNPIKRHSHTGSVSPAKLEEAYF